MSAPSRPVVVLEGISAGQYFADAALKRGLEPVVVFPRWLKHGMTPQESVAFSCLLGIFGWRQIEYGSYYKI